jgi:hypothetical protein
MSRVLLIAFLLTASTGFGGDQKPGAICYDFSKAINEPLSKPIPLLKDEDNFETGAAPYDVIWAAARGIVNLPVSKITPWLLDHSEWKDLSRTKLTLEKIPSPHYFELHRLSVDANVFAFIWLHWVEEWGYRVLKGTNAAPQALLVSYQKVEGTSHITRLCGSVLVQSMGKNKSDVSFYEEAKADRYEAHNIREMQVSNLFHLRQLIPKKGGKPAPENKPSAKSPKDKK